MWGGQKCLAELTVNVLPGPWSRNRRAPKHPNIMYLDIPMSSCHRFWVRIFNIEPEINYIERSRYVELLH